MKTKTRQVPFKIYLPATAEKKAEYVKTIEIEVYQKNGEDFVTLESRQLIEKTTAQAMGLLHGSEIKSLRESLNLTQDKLSDLIGCGKKTLSRWENGRGLPTSTYNKFLRLLDEGFITPAELIAIQGPREVEPEEATPSFFTERPKNIYYPDFKNNEPCEEAVQALLNKKENPQTVAL